MGIVTSQSAKNMVTIFGAFAIGAVNTLYFYPTFLKETYYGLVIFLLATSNLLMPLMAFGIQHTIIKFFSSYTDSEQKDRFLSTAILLPLAVILPISLLALWAHDGLIAWISAKNPIIESYAWVILLVAIATGYFEVFYAWARVQFQSVVGNVLKEIFPRATVFILMFCVMLEILSKEDFVWWLTGAYFLRLFLMILYAFSLHRPRWAFVLPDNFKSVLSYAVFIIVSGSAASLLLDIDKFMIPQKEAIEFTAFYAVAVFIATIVEVPGRALFQILNPLMAKAINENQTDEIQSLYQKSSINLLVFSGWLFLLINLSIHSFYEMIPQKEYAGAVWVVLIVSFAKLFQMSFGCGPAILANSKFYKITLPFSLAMGLSVYFLNDVLIDRMGINGAAFSTLIVLVFFTILKVMYIRQKIGTQPYTFKSIQLLAWIVVLFVAFNFLQWELNPLLSIVLTSLMVTVVYFTAVVIFGFSPELNRWLKRRS